MREKVCFKCLRSLPLSEFYRHPRMADGRLGKCKCCTRADVSANYANKREQYSAYDRRRNATRSRRAKRVEYQAACSARHPERYMARRAVSLALRAGKIDRKPCVFCGSMRSQAHHEDYSRSLEVIWVCFKHHREVYHSQTVTIEGETCH